MKQETLHVREALVLNYTGEHNIRPISGNLFGVFNDAGIKVAEVDIVQKTIRKTKAKRTWSYDHNSFEEVLNMVLTPVNSWSLLYMIGDRVYETVCAKKSYVYCTVRKSQAMASNNYRYGRLIIKPTA